MKRALLILNLTILIFPPPNSKSFSARSTRRQCEGLSGLAYIYNLVTLTLSFYTDLKSIILKDEELK